MKLMPDPLPSRRVPFLTLSVPGLAAIFAAGMFADATLTAIIRVVPEVVLFGALGTGGLLAFAVTEIRRDVPFGLAHRPPGAMLWWPGRRAVQPGVTFNHREPRHDR